MKSTASSLRELVEYLNSTNRSKIKHNSLVGFDRLVSVVEKKAHTSKHFSNSDPDPINQFSERLKCLSSDISGAAVQYPRTDGHAYVFSKAVGKLGGKCRCLGVMQVPVNSVFKYLATDWKRIASQLPPISHQPNDYSNSGLTMDDEEGFHQMKQPCTKSDFIFMGTPDCMSEVDSVAFMEWDKFPDACGLADSFLHNVIKPSGKKNFHFLFDFTEVTNKSVFDVDEILDVVSCFSNYGRVVFFLDEKVATEIWLVLKGYDLSRQTSDSVIPNVSEVILDIFNTMNIESIVVHSMRHTHIVIGNHVQEVERRWIGPQIPDSFAADNYSAGILVGMQMGLPIERCMLLGLAAMGVYVQNGHSADISDLLVYLSQWIDEITENGIVTNPA